MYFKWIGAVLVLLGCSYIGFSAAAQKKERITALYELEFLLARLTEQIDRYVPLSPAFCEISGGAGAGVIFRLAARFLDEGKPADQAFAKACGNVPLLPRDIEALETFGRGLSAADREGQQANIKLCAARLAALRLEAEQDAARTGRLCRSGGVLAGLLLAIVLY